MINANSAALTDHEEAADPHEQYALDTDLATLQTEITTHKAENATDAHNAGNIGFLPTGMTATDLQEAVEEVFTSGNNVKVNTVGALLSVDENC